jgi:hypothetical protein
LISVFNLGDLYHRTGRDAKAEPLMREALVGLERFEEAEALALDNHRLRGERFGADHSLTAEAADVLVEIYEKTGRPDEAARYRSGP